MLLIVFVQDGLNGDVAESYMMRRCHKIVKGMFYRVVV